MGLDMYLERRVYVKNWEHMKKEQLTEVSAVRDGKQVVDPKKVSYLIEEVAYWRKANAIHNWFVNNCANGVDECQTIDVPTDKLKELRDLCAEVLKVAKVVKGKVTVGKRGTKTGWEDIKEEGEYIANAEEVAELLPTASGFFFGSTDYDQFYLADVKFTKEVLDEALENEDGYFEYHASW